MYQVDSVGLLPIVEDEDGQRFVALDETAPIHGAQFLALSQRGVRGIWLRAEGMVADLRDLVYVQAWDWWDFPENLRVAPSWRDLIATQEAAPAFEPFVHLHAHSEYSPLDGLSTVGEMVDRAVAMGQPAMAVTDHGVCAGHAELQTLADEAEADIKPVFGLEAYLVDDRTRVPMGRKFWAAKLAERGIDDKETIDRLHAEDMAAANDYYHLILWAEDDEGLRNIWAASTEANRDGHHRRPRMDWDTLARHSKGVLCSTACLRGPLNAPLLKGDDDRMVANAGRLLGIYGEDHLWVELHTNRLPEQERSNVALASLASSLGLPTVAVSDSHYPCATDAATHKVWLATATNSDLQDESGLFEGDQHYHLMSKAEAAEALDYLPASVVDEAIAQTVVVADRCNARIVKRKGVPVFSRSGLMDDDAAELERLCRANWWMVEGKAPPPGSEDESYEARYQREIALIRRQGFCGYFLQVSEYCRWARSQGCLVGPGRGSGGGCLVAFLAQITAVDPVANRLLFERFMTEGRSELPDFDVDFPTSWRPRMFAHVAERWGQDHVVRIGSHLRRKNRSTVRDLFAAYRTTMDIHWPDVDAICDIIEDSEVGTFGKGLTWSELLEGYSDKLAPYIEKYPVVFDLAAKIAGRLKTYGKHAAGVVISPYESLDGTLPLRRADEGFLVTEFDYRALEHDLGLVKMDFLFLKNLDIIQGAMDHIKDLYGVQVDPYSWVGELDDPAVWDEIGDGRTMGMFQVEKAAGTRECKRFKPRSIADLADVITLIRPGPKESGATEEYFRRRSGTSPVTYAHPLLEDVLSQTYGLMLYQEDVMKVCQVIGGYSLEEADRVRRLLGKKETQKVEAEGRTFVAGAVANGIDSAVAERLWEQMGEFAKYSFNRSHAFAYALIGYWCAWCKVHYPLAFFGSVLTVADKDRTPDFVAEARRMGYRILPPDVNRSGLGFSVDREVMAVRYGIDSVKGIGEASAQAILEAQPYDSFDDFVARRGSAANAGHIATLARIGFFDSIYPHRRALVERLAWERSPDSGRCVDWDESVEGDLPCRFDWTSEPVELTARGNPKKPKPPPKRCTKACRQYRSTAAPSFVDLDWYTDAEIREIERESLGLYLTSTPFDDLPADVVEKCLTAEQLEAALPGYEYPVLGVVTRIKDHVTTGGDDMAFVAITAQDSEVDLVVFPKVWARLRGSLVKDAMVLVSVAKTDRGFQLRDLAWTRQPVPQGA